MERGKSPTGKCVKKFREHSVKKEKLFETDAGRRVLFFSRSSLNFSNFHVSDGIFCILFFAAEKKYVAAKREKLRTLDI